MEASPGGSEPLEAELVARAQGGNLFAFEELVRRHQRRVYAVALRIVRRHDLADDVVQEAFVRAHQNLARFDGARPFGPWICRIAANQAVNRLRSPVAREQPLPEGHAETPAASPDPLTGVLEDEARRVLDAALGELPAEQRAVFVLRTVEELSYKEIAETLGIPEGSVMSRLFRARERLRAALQPYLGAALARAGAGKKR
jgi:RNA polymerase sigma-70 factor (ECF subfamily)